MNKNIILILLAILSAGFANPIFGEEISLSGKEGEQNNSKKPKFTFKPSGRILLDGAFLTPEHGEFRSGVAIPDIRLGGTFGYGNWLLKLDIGYGFGTLGAKDVFLQYTFDDFNLIRAGYFVHQFGLQSSTSSTMKPMFDTPVTDSFMAATDRNIGVMYVYDKNQFMATASLIFGNPLSQRANNYGRISAGGISRLVWRPVRTGGKVFQVGVSGWYQTAMHKLIENADGDKVVSPGYFDYSADYPTRVDDIKLIGDSVTAARGVVKLSPDILLSAGPVALEAQYYYMNINRQHLPSYTAQGFYGYFRWLIFGDKYYSYSSPDGGLSTPNPKTLEMVAGYDYTNANSAKAGIYGGITNDISVTFNYYINKFMLARLRYSYTNVHNSATVPTDHINIIEARLQFQF